MVKVNKDNCKKVIEMLKCYNVSKMRINLFNLNIEQSNDKGYIDEQREKIKYYERFQDNIRKCLKVLNEKELEFIQLKIFKKKKYYEIIPLINKLYYNDEKINQRVSIDMTKLCNNGSVIKRVIIIKLLSTGILDLYDPKMIW